LSSCLLSDLIRKSYAKDKTKEKIARSLKCNDFIDLQYKHVHVENRTLVW